MSDKYYNDVGVKYRLSLSAANRVNLRCSFSTKLQLDGKKISPIQWTKILEEIPPKKLTTVEIGFHRYLAFLYLHGYLTYEECQWIEDSELEGILHWPGVDPNIWRKLQAETIDEG